MPRVHLGRDFYLNDRTKILVILKSNKLLFYTTASRSCCNKAISYSELCQRPVGHNVCMFAGCGHAQFPSNALGFKRSITKGTQILYVLGVRTEGIAPLRALRLLTED